MNQGTCETCRWRHEYTKDKHECRLNPPVVLSESDGSYVQSICPDVKPDHWCSHHTPKPLPATGEKVGPPEHPDFDMRPINETP